LDLAGRATGCAAKELRKTVPGLDWSGKM